MMELISWVIILILVAFALVFLKYDHHKKQIRLVVLVLILLLLYFSIRGVFTSTSNDLTSPRGIVGALYTYFGWLGQTLGNLWDIGTDTVRTVGNAIKINSTG